MTGEPTLTERFDRALLMAHRYHADQVRKGVGTPYFGHLLGVASIVIDEGGDEDQAIAALLHDAPEDQGGEETLAEIEREFGSRVAGIVEHLSDTFEEPKPPWRDRKESYLERLRVEDDAAVLLVSIADKLHNARSILLDLRDHGDGVWERFKGGRDGSLWYYAQLSRIYDEAYPGVLADEFRLTVERLQIEAGAEVRTRATAEDEGSSD
jgi:(p)ppGpp synthase/HD superfamily hydrolase